MKNLISQIVRLEYDDYQVWNCVGDAILNSDLNGYGQYMSKKINLLECHYY